MRRALITLALAGLSACGGRPTINFPVDDNRPVSSLTPAELQSMCNTMASSVGDALRMSCMMKGVMAKFEANGTTQTCQTSYDTCMAKYQGITANCTLTSTSDVLKDCTATVGEYEACVNDGLALLDTLNHRLSCSMSLGDLQNLAVEMQSAQQGPPSCQALAKKCPKLNGVTGGG
jgi:hypothetical protein